MSQATGQTRAVTATAPMTESEYRDLSDEGRAIARCFIPFRLLPECALVDMRSLSIHGSSLARQIVDEGTASESAIRRAQYILNRASDSGRA